MRTELKNRIEAALETLRPFLQADGGDVSLLEITEDNKVKIEFLGACNLMTFKAGIEEAILKAAPEIISVEAVNKIATPALD
jgi:Fe-S cluster biogenesis protein NfuA